MKIRPILAALLFCAGTAAAQASSDDAWSAFAKEVEQKCLAVAKGTIEAPKAVVDPYGSERFGLAIVTGKARGAKVHISAICVFDKKTRKAEIGGEFGQDVLSVKTGN